MNAIDNEQAMADIERAVFDLRRAFIKWHLLPPAAIVLANLRDADFMKANASAWDRSKLTVHANGDKAIVAKISDVEIIPPNAFWDI